MPARSAVQLAAASDASTYARYLRDGEAHYGHIGEGRRRDSRDDRRAAHGRAKGKDKGGGKGVRAGSLMDLEFWRQRQRPQPLTSRVS